jgi:DNA topoisomerase VI subunit B
MSMLHFIPEIRLAFMVGFYAIVTKVSEFNCKKYNLSIDRDDQPAIILVKMTQCVSAPKLSNQDTDNES